MINEFKSKRNIALAAASVMFAVLLVLPASVRSEVDTSSNIKVLNTALLNQNGTPVKFATDIISDKIIVMNFIYTDCSTACPVVSAIFAKLQTLLGKKLQQDIRMVSLSINPITDTPEKLKSYATHFQAQPEWVWLTGEKSQVNDLLKGLGVYSADYSNHKPVILIGDAISGTWTRFDGFTSPETLAAKIDELLLARREKS